jgi:hypothetical protein
MLGGAGSAVCEANPFLPFRGNNKLDARHAIRDIAIEGGEISGRERLQFPAPSCVWHFHSEDSVQEIEWPGAGGHGASARHRPGQQGSIACGRFADSTGDDFLQSACRRLQFVLGVGHERFSLPLKFLILASNSGLVFQPHQQPGKADSSLRSE